MKQTNFKIISHFAIMASITVLLGGCLTTPQEKLTPEQQAQAAQMREAFMQRMQAGIAGLQKNQAPQQQLKASEPQIPEVSTEELLAQMQVITATGGPARFNVERDGVLVNDQVYLDPEGTVERAGWDVMTGNFTYTVSNFDGSKTLKFYRAGSSSAPMVVAIIQKNGQGYRIKTLDDQIIAGSSFIPTSNGVIVSRGSSVFEYKIGERLNSVSIPSGWNVAKFQKGDVDSSGLILLEREKQAKKEKNSGFGGMISGFSEIGRSFGLAEVFDYALYDLNSRQSVLLNMSLDDKQVNVLKNCVKQNNYVNKCSDMDTYNSLYEKNGNRNRLHYYWSLDWFNTPAGPMAVYNSGTQLIAVDVKGETNMTLFQRT